MCIVNINLYYYKFIQKIILFIYKENTNENINVWILLYN